MCVMALWDMTVGMDREDLAEYVENQFCARARKQFGIDPFYGVPDEDDLSLYRFYAGSSRDAADPMVYVVVMYDGEPVHVFTFHAGESREVIASTIINAGW